MFHTNHDATLSRPLVTIDRLEIEDKAEEIVYVKITDTPKEKEAHFHLVVGIRNGRPYAEITAIAKNPHSDKRTSRTAPWKNSLRT